MHLVPCTPRPQRGVIRTDGGGAPCQGSPCPVVEVVGRAHAQERGMKAGVDVHPARDDDVAISVDDLHPSWHDEVFPYLPEDREKKKTVDETNKQKKHIKIFLWNSFFHYLDAK